MGIGPMDWDAVPDIDRSIAVAHQILWLRRNIETTPMQVLKLVYICHGVVLGYHEEPLIDEPVEAWRYGPVIPSVYHSFKYFRDNPIATTPAEQGGLTERDKGVIKQVELIHRRYSGIQLSTLTHARGTPWDITVRRTGPGSTIPNGRIQTYYAQLLRGGTRAKGR